jgi:hypothetical protein
MAYLQGELAAWRRGFNLSKCNSWQTAAGPHLTADATASMAGDRMARHSFKGAAEAALLHLAALARGGVGQKTHQRPRLGQRGASPLRVLKVAHTAIIWFHGRIVLGGRPLDIELPKNRRFPRAFLGNFRIFRSTLIHMDISLPKASA